MTVLPGEVAFRLYDTFGFPLDLMTDLAREQGNRHRSGRVRCRHGWATGSKSRGRSVSRCWPGYGGCLCRGVSTPTQFIGYGETEGAGTILALIGNDGPVSDAEAGQPVEVILDITPFYGESGGQVGDKGTMRTETGLINIDDTFKPSADLFVHRGTVAEGFVQVGETVQAHVDADRRKSIMRNHTATHLLHRALRMVLGEETHQAGSLVAPDRLRFDFTSLDAVSNDQVHRVAEIVNQQILASTPVTTLETPYKEAVSTGAMALFGEKYGDTVRVVSIETFSKELCGGTHVAHTGEIGPFVVVSEGSVAAGVRRIEALTGTAAIERVLHQQSSLEQLARELRVSWTAVPEQFGSLRERLRNAEREIDRLKGQIAGKAIGAVSDDAITIGDLKVLAVQLDVESKEGLRKAGDQLRSTLGSGVLVIGAVVDGKPSVLAMASKEAVEQGVHAGNLVRTLVATIDGKGGGRPDVAEGGGKDPDRLPELIASVPQQVELMLGESPSRG